MSCITIELEGRRFRLLLQCIRRQVVRSWHGCHRLTLAMHAHTHETTCHHLVYGACGNISVLLFQKDAVQTVIPQESVTECQHSSPRDDLLLTLKSAASGGRQASHGQSLIHFAVPSAGQKCKRSMMLRINSTLTPVVLCTHGSFIQWLIQAMAMGNRTKNRRRPAA